MEHLPVILEQLGLKEGDSYHILINKTVVLSSNELNKGEKMIPEDDLVPLIANSSSILDIVNVKCDDLREIFSAALKNKDEKLCIKIIQILKTKNVNFREFDLFDSDMVSFYLSSRMTELLSIFVSLYVDDYYTGVILKEIGRLKDADFCDPIVNKIYEKMKTVDNWNGKIHYSHGDFPNYVLLRCILEKRIPIDSLSICREAVTREYRYIFKLLFPVLDDKGKTIIFLMLLKSSSNEFKTWFIKSEISTDIDRYECDLYVTVMTNDSHAIDNYIANIRGNKDDEDWCPDSSYNVDYRMILAYLCSPETYQNTLMYINGD